MRAAWLIAVLVAAGCSTAEQPQPVDSAQGGGGEGGADLVPLEPEPLPGTWSELAPLSVALTSTAAAANGTSVFVLGGIETGSTATASALVYDSATQTSQGIVDLPQPAAGGSAFVRGDTLYFAGGIAALSTSPPSTAYDTCHRIAIGGSAWAPCATIGNGPTTHAATANTDEATFLFGGIRRIDQNGLFPTQFVQRFEYQSAAWEAVTMMPELRDGAAAVITNGLAHVIGGRTLTASGVSVPGAVLTYDFETYQWNDAVVAPLSTPRVSLSCALRRGFVYCFGGYDAAGNTVDTVDRLELATGQWTPLAPLPKPLYSAQAVALDDAVLILGGSDSNDAPSAAVYRLD